MSVLENRRISTTRNFYMTSFSQTKIETILPSMTFVPSMSQNGIVVSVTQTQTLKVTYAFLSFTLDSIIFCFTSKSTLHLFPPSLVSWEADFSGLQLPNSLCTLTSSCVWPMRWQNTEGQKEGNVKFIYSSFSLSWI